MKSKSKDRRREPRMKRVKPKHHLPEIEHRSFLIEEREVDWLLKLSKRVHFPSKLLNALVDKKTEFQDYMLKIKETIKTAKANAHWHEQTTAVPEELDRIRREQNKELRDVLNEIACPTLKEMKKILSKERIQKNVKAAIKKRSQASKPKRKTVKRKVRR